MFKYVVATFWADNLWSIEEHKLSQEINLFLAWFVIVLVISHLFLYMINLKSIMDLRRIMEISE